MFAGQTKRDDQDAFLHSHVGKWVRLEWRNDLFAPPQGQAYGSHLATLIVCPFGAEIRGVNYCWLYTDKSGRVFRVGEPLAGIGATWILKYSTLKQFRTDALLPSDIDFLDLPDLDARMHADVPEPIREVRKDRRLQTFHHPGFPDDVSATCEVGYPVSEKGVPIQHEQVWVRLTGRASECRFTGILLNQSILYQYPKDTPVTLLLLESTDGDTLVCERQVTT